MKGLKAGNGEWGIGNRGIVAARGFAIAGDFRFPIPDSPFPLIGASA